MIQSRVYPHMHGATLLAHARPPSVYGPALFKRAIDGTFHHTSTKHLPGYTAEFEGRHAHRPLDTAEIMDRIVRDSARKRMTYTRLVSSPNAR